MMTEHRDNPDETEGRRLYRARADALASAQMNMASRRFRMRDHGEKLDGGKDG